MLFNMPPLSKCVSGLATVYVEGGEANTATGTTPPTPGQSSQGGLAGRIYTPVEMGAWMGAGATLAGSDPGHRPPVHASIPGGVKYAIRSERRGVEGHARSSGRG